MMDSLEQRIDSYLSNRMAEKEKLDFEKEMTSETSLQKEVQLQKAAYLAIEKHGDAEIRERVHHWENPASPTLLKRYWWRLALPIVIVYAAIFLYNAFSKPHLEEDLFEEYFETVVYRSTTSYPAETFPNWNNGTKAYKQGDYETATSFYEEHLRRQTETQEALFYTGMAFLSQDPPNLKKAQFYLGQVTGKQNPYTNTAKWNLALAYLKEGRIVRTKKLLRELLAKGNYRKDDVKELLERLSLED